MIFQIIGVILSLTGVIFIITKADLNLIKNILKLLLIKYQLMMLYLLQIHLMKFTHLMLLI